MKRKGFNVLSIPSRPPTAKEKQEFAYRAYCARYRESLSDEYKQLDSSYHTLKLITKSMHRNGYVRRSRSKTIRSLILNLPSPNVIKNLLSSVLRK